MMLHSLLAVLVSLTSWTSPVSASLRITANHHSFGGVNYPQLQFFAPQHRDDSIREIVKSGARVIRLFIRPDAQHPDPEGELGGFDKSLLDQFDDTLAAIHHLSKGQVKVIIAPHDAHALRGSNDVPCDAYCQKLNGAFLDFYSSEEYRNLYKTRLEVFFKHYPSRNFDGRSWGSLSEVILGVDLQNQPFSGISPIPSGESWLCDMASYLKFSIGLDSAGIAVISGGVSGPQSVDGNENFPDSVFDCKAIDVIGIHGYFDKTAERTAGTPWAEMFLPGNTLTGRAMGKGKKGKEGKLLLVEEWTYVHNPDFGLFYKKEAVFDQGNALNYRGIPWGKTSRINPIHPTYTTWTALTDVLKRSVTARSNFNWTKYLPPPVSIIPPSADEKTAQHLQAMLTGSNNQEWKLKPLGLSNVSSVVLNPYIIEQSDCTFGCLGHLCDAADSCSPDLLCKNSVCQPYSETQPGKVGERCNSKAVCQSHLRCDEKQGYCNDYGRCDYVPDASKKKSSGPGGARGKRNSRIAGVPKGHERGPARVRDEAMRINIPKEKVAETGGPAATATA
ncbi:hypothetical protein AA0114_g9106 [Alternaria tenuissima]|uniref:Glycoside hydrolase family 5 domain-containing protein n=1 Tax=Alternaria tenuissima TaxID=119927 RepID=A0A4Q4M8T3_9PLEO|nr:hypothetical protein AA0114_g9106 [Alternaria tenuissima]